MEISNTNAPRPFYAAEIQTLHQMPNRTETMYLKTIPVEKKENNANKIYNGDANDTKPFSLRTDDIQFRKRVSHGSDFLLRTDDLDQKKSRFTREGQRNIYDSLYNDDIHKAKTKVHQFETKREPSNPLNPIYNGFKETEVEYEPLRFLKDPLNVTDIDGAQSHWRHRVKKQKLQQIVSNPQKYSPIVTCQVQDIVFRSEIQHGKNADPLCYGDFNQKKVLTNSKSSSLHVTDISKTKTYRLSKRCVDPLNPQYYYYDIERRPEFLEGIKKSKSSIRHPERNKVNFMLETKDIAGAQPNTNAYLFLRGNERKTFGKTNDLSNIHNINPGSCKKSIKTKRCTDPLERNYPYPDGYHEGFQVGTEYKDQSKLPILYKSGKLIINEDDIPKHKKNWNIINHIAKDPTLIENFRSEGKLINKDWVRPDNDLFLLDNCYISKEDKINMLKKATAAIRNPIVGDNVDYKIYKPVIVTEEEKLNYMQMIKSHPEKLNLTVDKENAFASIQRTPATRPIKNGFKSTTQKFRKIDDTEFKVSFKPVHTIEQKFDHFITRN
jgi:hypothetical protein